MTQEELEMRKLVRESDVIDRTDESELAKAFKYLWEKYIEQEPKTGWYIAHGMYNDRFWCSCGFIKVMDSSMLEWKYCPVCGRTKIVESQESGVQDADSN